MQYTKPAFPSHVESRDFASVAEAKAHYYADGFRTIDESERGEPHPWTIMRKTLDNGYMLETLIRHRGLLMVDANVVRLA